MRRDVIIWNGIDVTMRFLTEICFVSFSRLFIPVRGKDTFTTHLLKREAKSTNAAEEIYESELSRFR